MHDLFARVDISRRRFVERLAGGAFAAASLLSFPKSAAAQVGPADSPSPSSSGVLPSLSPSPMVSPSPVPSPSPSPSPSFLPSPTPPPTPSSTPAPSPSLPSKVKICHRGHTIEVSLASLAEHLAHGDTLGPCKHKDDDDDDGDDDDHGHGGDDDGG